MRPKLEHSRLLPALREVTAVTPDDAFTRETVPAPADQSGVQARVPPDYELPPTRQPDLPELDAVLGRRLFGLELSLGSLGDARVLVEARKARASLAQASEYAELAPGARSFDALLADTLVGVYGWMFGALDAISRGEYVRPMPRRLSGELANHADVAAMRSVRDASLAPLEGVLHDLARASERLTRCSSR